MRAAPIRCDGSEDKPRNSIMLIAPPLSPWVESDRPWSSVRNVCIIAYDTGYKCCHTGVKDVNSIQCSSTVAKPRRSMKIEDKQLTSSSSSCGFFSRQLITKLQALTNSLLSQPLGSGKTSLAQSSHRHLRRRPPQQSDSASQSRRLPMLRRERRPS
ncbi:hypothetical protein PoB_003137500 [Plakobranchus ocellatus]|uniref:Uncharacterized protein n=1 Tax=Plakobranchus ocellatus TaxID=259542 RepID=A0AAV4A9L9_9GAST|nr:hypothetical protein PoB_003137500 [Plakobranchus ocellatus]